MPDSTCSLPFNRKTCSRIAPTCSPNQQKPSSDLFPHLFPQRELGTCSLFPHRRWGTGNNPAAGRTP